MKKMKNVEKEESYDYFRFTKHRIDNRELSSKREFEVCQKWLEDFEKKGIPACIVQSRTKKRMIIYDVWRKGKEYSSNNLGNTEPLPLDGEIVDATNNWGIE